MSKLTQNIAVNPGARLTASLQELILRAEAILSKLEDLLPKTAPAVDWNSAIAFQWVTSVKPSRLQVVPHPHQISLGNLLGIEEQKARLQGNIKQFLQGLPANNVLLTGARGTGKSSLVKAMLNHYSAEGLRLIEINKTDLVDLPHIMAEIHGRPEKFIVYCDDLSFEAEETAYKALKVALDGSIRPMPENAMIIATSNRRHLLPEFFSENLQSYRDENENEIHPGEAVEQKISLSERFGLWISFHPFNQDQYLAIVQHWLDFYSVANPTAPGVREAALQWALLRGSRSGRTASQFARDWAGKVAIG